MTTLLKGKKREEREEYPKDEGECFTRATNVARANCFARATNVARVICFANATVVERN
jgi:hypothetical protein